MKVFIQCQFNYCPLVWIFHSLKLHNTIKLHARSLRIVYNDKKSTFEEFLGKDNSVSIHHKNIQKLAKEIYKAKNNLSPQITQDIFQITNTLPNTRIKLKNNYGAESI